jgi:hypothetical protein
MRTRILAAAVAAAALLPVSLLAATPASAATKHDVLTYGKVGGTNVAAKSILTANLASKTAVFAAASATLTCTKSTITVKVIKNPAAKGKATESLTSQTFSHCSASGSLAADIKNPVLGLTKGTYAVTVSDAKNFPVVVTKPSATVTVDVTVAGIGTITCIYKAPTADGNAANKHNTVAFKNQVLTEAKGSNADCAALPSAKFSATYGPVLDQSVKGKKKPAVFVN